MRDRSHIFDGGHFDTEGLNGTHSGLTAGARTTKANFSFTETMAHCLTAGILSNDLSGVCSAFTGTTEAHLAAGGDGLPVKLSGAAAAVGVATGILWEKVLKPGKNDRLIDQVRTFESLTKTSKLVDDPKQQQSLDPVTDDALRGIGAAVVQALAAAALRRAGNIDG